MVGEQQFTVNFPNIGQIIEIESLKQGLTSNRYGNMAASGIGTMFVALDLVDTIAFMQVMLPNMKATQGIANYAVADITQLRALVDAYKKDIEPWYVENLNGIKSIAKTDGQNNRTDQTADVSAEG